MFYRMILASLLWAACRPLSLAAEDLLAQADALYERGGIQNYREAIELYLRYAENHPHDFGAQWKCARALREYGEKAKRLGQKDWKAVCAETGKAGMEHSEKAIELAADRPEGYYYYGLNAGIYSDGKSILAAMKEGLKTRPNGASKERTKLIRCMPVPARLWPLAGSGLSCPGLCGTGRKP